MHRSRKPVGKCYGCGLNLGDECGVYDVPLVMWEKHSVCPGFKNEKMLAEFEAQQAKLQANQHKTHRKEVAKLRKTAQHENGDRHVILTAGRK